MNKKMNKGEWSEFYTFLKLISEKVVYGATKDLKKDEDFLFDIFSFDYTSELGGKIEIKINNNNTITATYNKNTCNIPIKQFVKAYEIVLDRINIKIRTFEIPEIHPILTKLFLPKLKAPNTSKRDLTIKLKRTSDSKLLVNHGFSVKSNLAAKTSLLNASKQTNFTYKVNTNIDEKTKKLKTKNLVKKIGKDNISFNKLISDSYNYNLKLIDTQFIKIISEVLLEYYSSKGNNKVINLIKIIAKNDPLSLNDEKIYLEKMADFLEATALGMNPNNKWDKIYDADGGMLIVRTDGEVVCFYIIHSKLRKAFREYLLNEAFLDTASTKRHDFGYIKNNNEIDLNLLIRI